MTNPNDQLLDDLKALQGMRFPFDITFSPLNRFLSNDVYYEIPTSKDVRDKLKLLTRKIADADCEKEVSCIKHYHFLHPSEKHLYQIHYLYESTPNLEASNINELSAVISLARKVWEQGEKV